MIKVSSSNYKWYILLLTTLTYGIIAGAERMCMPVLFKEISTSLNLSLVSIGTIWGMDPLAGIFTGLPAGLLADRFGIKRTLTVVCLLAGLFCALRGLSVNFLSMVVYTFLFGFMASMTPGIAPKATAVWFSSDNLALTNALITVSSSIGTMVATLTSATYLSPLLGGWRNVLFLMGAPAIIIGLLWLFTGREPLQSERQLDARSKPPPFLESLSKVVRMKSMWLFGFLSFAIWGATIGLGGYLPIYLRDIGWSPAGADRAVTALSGVTTLGTIPMILISNHFKSHNGMLLFSIAVLASSLALIPLVGGSGFWALIIVSGFLRSGTLALTNVLVFLTPGVGGTFGGTALGLVSSVGMIGAALAPPLGNSLARLGSGVPFYFWAGLAALAIPIFLILMGNLKKLDNK